MRAPTLTFKRARRLRREMTLPEVILWGRLRRGGLAGVQFRRQHPAGPYILDFYCPAARLAVELDGAAHAFPDRVQHDARRDAWLAEQGVRVLRLAAAAVLDDEGLEGVLRTVAEAVAPSTAFGGPPPPQSG